MKRRNGERGNAIVEFALVITPLLFLLMGVSVVGMNLGRSVQGAQICRDAASMYVRGIDFSQNGNKDILVRLANTFGMTRSGGNGVVLLSKVTWISQATCTARSLTPCNGDRHVMTQRVTVGNTALHISALGTPSPLDSIGQVSNYYQNTTAVATFPYMQLQEGEYAYVVETYFPSLDINFPGFYSGTGVNSIAIF